MDRNEVIALAREAGLLTIGTADGSVAVYTWPKGITEELERFAALAYAAGADAEREACAKVCEDMCTVNGYERDLALVSVATAIRARKENT